MNKISFLFFLLLSNVFASNFNTYIDNIKVSQVIDKKVIKIGYDYNVKGPRYVYYSLNKDLISLNNFRKRPRFYTEKNIPKKYRVTPSDYINTNYDRGHMAPDADFDYDKKILLKVYTMANIVPQKPILNQKIWIKVEERERYLTKKYGNLNIVNIIEYKNKNNFLKKMPIDKIIERDKKRKNYKPWSKKKYKKYKNYEKKLNRKKIVIPSGFYKILFNDKIEECYFYENKEYNYSLDKISKHKINCNLIKR
jgi:endonuclease G